MASAGHVQLHLLPTRNNWISDNVCASLAIPVHCHIVVFAISILKEQLAEYRLRTTKQMRYLLNSKMQERHRYTLQKLVEIGQIVVARQS